MVVVYELVQALEVKDKPMAAIFFVSDKDIRQDFVRVVGGGFDNSL